MNLQIRDLAYFIAVAELKHFGRAAHQTGASQPTLSMQLKKLEKQLGGKLLERLPRDVILTPFGKEILPLAREILRLAGELEHRSTGGEHQGRLRLGMIPTISPYLLPKITRGLSRELKGKKIAFVEAQTSDLVRSVREGSIDVGILSTPLKDRTLETVELYSEPFFAAFPSNHQLAKRTEVRLKDLKDERLLLLSEGHCLRNQASSLCKLSQSDDDSDLSATSIETLKSMVAIGAGVTLIPQLAVGRRDGVSYLPLKEDIANRSIGIIYRRSFADTNLVQAVAAVIRSAAEKEKLQLS